MPSYVSSVSTSGKGPVNLVKNDLQALNKDLLDYRVSSNTWAAVNNFAKVNPDLSAAIASHLRLSLSKSYTVVARNWDGTINEEGTAAALQFSQKLDCINDGGKSIRSICEALGLELQKYGSCCSELILGPGFLPMSVEPVSTTQVEWVYANKRRMPQQKVGSQVISLDIPTFFYTELDCDITTAYSESPQQSALQPIMASQDLTNDIRKVVKQAVHPKTVVTIDTEKWLASLAPEVRLDKDLLKAAMAETDAGIRRTLNAGNPEDAWVQFDAVEITYLNNGNSSISKEYEIISKIFNGKIAAGTKTSATVLGHDATGSANISSTESMLTIKNVAGALQYKLNEHLSRVFTMALRLLGLDVVCHFEWSSIELRTDLELEAFAAMRQSRILELRSIGDLTDLEASLLLTGTLPEKGAPTLSGTMFYSKQSQTTSNPYSNTSGTGRATNQALNDGLKPAAPANKKGS